MPIMRKLAISLACGCALLALAAANRSSLAADREVVLLPAGIALLSPESRQTVVAQWRAGDDFQQQVTPQKLHLQSSDDTIVKIQEGLAVPVANGSATITATIGGQSASANVVVTGMEKPFQWSFRNHV